MSALSSVTVANTAQTFPTLTAVQIGCIARWGGCGRRGAAKSSGFGTAVLAIKRLGLSLLLIGTGLRVGEAIGLRWGDIDFGGRKLTVARDIWHGKINSPKYAASERVVPLGPVLAEHLMNQAKGPEQWVFEGNAGKPLDPRYLARRQFYPVLDELEIPRFSWHRLRKLHSTYMADLGVAPRVLQAQLGHADAALTLNIYTQVLPESQRKAVEALEGLLFRNVPKRTTEVRVQ